MAISLGLRFQILQREGFACLICEGREAPLRIRFLRPVAFGGVEHPSNLGAICDNCGGIEADIIPADKAVSR